MAALTLTVKMVGEPPQDYQVTPFVEVAYERQFNSPISTMTRNEHLYWLAWKAKHTAGDVVKPFDDWLKDVELVEEPKVDDPLASGPSASASPGSPSEAGSLPST